MANEFKIQTRFTGIDQLSRTTKAIAKNFGVVTRAALSTNRAIKAVSNTATKMGQSLRTASLAGAIGLTAALTPIVAFSDNINELEAVSRASTVQMAQMTAQAKKLGSETRFSASQAAAAQTFLARASFKTNEILDATPHVLNLAAASNMELARTADIASNIMGAFKIEAKDMATVADVLAGVTSSANVDLEQLAESLKFAAPIANKAGLTLEETASAIGLLGNVGIQGSMAGTALTRILTQLAAPAGKASKVLRDLGVETTILGEMKKPAVILADIAKGIKKLPGGEQIGAIKEIFGLLGISAGAELIDQAGLGNMDLAAEKMLTMTGRSQEMADIMNKGPGGAIRMLKSAAEGLAISIGDSGLTGQFTNIVNKLTEFTSQLSQSETKTLANVAVMLTLLAVLAPIALGIGAIVGAIAPMVTGLIWLGGIIGAFIIPLIKKLILDFIILSLVNPFAAIVLAVVAVIAIFTALVFFWDEIVNGFKLGVASIVGFLQPLLDIFATIGEIGGLFFQTFGFLGDDSESEGDTTEQPSLPAKAAANQASAQANANATIEFVGTPQTGVIVSGSSGEEIDPLNGVTAMAGL